MGECDMGCQPDWHHDECAIYLPDTPTPAVPDPTVEARIAGVLREHARWEHGTGPDGYPTHRCRCGVDLPHGRADRVAPLHRAHVAAALAPLLTARAAAPDALRVAVEALAAEWRCLDFSRGCPAVLGEDGRADWCIPCRHAADLRALLEDGAQ